MRTCSPFPWLSGAVAARPAQTRLLRRPARRVRRPDQSRCGTAHRCRSFRLPQIATRVAAAPPPARGHRSQSGWHDRAPPRARLGAVEKRHIQILGGEKAPSGPPTCTERRRRPSRSPPPNSSTILRIGMPSSTSYTPGAANASLRHTSFVPVSGALPRRAKAAPPRATIHGTAARVSTLLTAVGAPNNPDEVGYGGRGRTAPRRPSSACSRAVSSPAT